MEDRESVKLTILLAVIAILLAPLSSQAYALSAHRLLTDQSVKFFKDSYPDLNISNPEEFYILQGAQDEDDDPRYLNHFYDPTNDRGLDFAGVNWVNSKLWATDTKYQNTFAVSNKLDGLAYGSVKDWFSGADDYSWDRAIYEYAWGDRNRGLVTLGHILHLVEDMHVPEHTRNDSHPNLAAEVQDRTVLTAGWMENVGMTDSSPYEIYTRQFDLGSENLSSKLKNSGIKPITKASLADYFIDDATYTNENFFSRDTIDKYASPNKDNLVYTPFGFKDEYAFGLSVISDRLTKLVLRERIFNTKLNKNIDKFSVIDSDNLIMSDYWNILSKQAVMNGAGVIKLFFDEVAKEKQTKELYNKNRSALGKAIDNFKKTIFGAANILYGVSVTPQDLAEDAPAPTAVAPVTTPTPTPIIKTTVTESATAPIIVSTSEPVPPVTPPATNYISETYVGAVPDWYPRQVGNPSQDSGGGGGAISNSQPTINNAVTMIADDSSATTTASTTPVVVADVTAPDVSLSITECTASLSVGGCLLLNGNITAHWSSAAADLQTYELRVDGAVIPLAFATSTSAVATLSDNATHTISLRAQDLTGNWSQPETKNVEVFSRPVIINEVAWAGTSATNPNDEWLEIYNPTDSDIALTNWTFYSASQKPYINLTGTIRAKSYFLLERGSDDVVSDIAADQIYGNGGASFSLNNAGETLYLAHASTTVDQVALCGTAWCGGSSANYSTMERTNSDDAVWSTNIYTIRNGKNRTNQNIYGTPKARNGVNYLIANGTANIASNNTLKKASSPYLVNGNTQTVAASATLSIEPGVVIKFVGNSGLNVNGTLSAQGTASEPIVFTSFVDDAFAGDTNSDATSTAPAPGNWYGLALKQGSDASVIDYAIIRYGGLYYNGQTQSRANLSIENASPTLSNSTSEYAKVYGLSLLTSSSTIANNIFQNQSTGLYVVAGAPQILNNTFTVNSRGLDLASAGGRVSGNTFTNNPGQAIVASLGTLSAVDFSENSGTGNSSNGISLIGLLPVGEHTLAANALPYLPNGFTVPAGAVLNVNAGTVFKPQGRMYVYGSLNLNGTTPTDIIFTSPADDSILGDTLNDGAAISPQAGDWYGPIVYSGGTFSGTGFTMRYGGCSAYGCSEAAALTVKSGGTASIANALFENNYPYGLRVEQATTTVQNTSFQDHRRVGSWGAAAALSAVSANMSLDSLAFVNNAMGIMDAVSTWIASGITFENNSATTTPANLF